MKLHVSTLCQHTEHNNRKSVQVSMFKYNKSWKRHIVYPRGKKKIQDFNILLQKWSINCLLSVLGCSEDLIATEKPYIKFLGRDGANAGYGGVGTTLSTISRAAASAEQHLNAHVSTAVNGDAAFENKLSALLFPELNKYLFFPRFTRPL